MGPKRTPKNRNPKPKFKDPPLLHPDGVKLKPAKVADLQVLMQFIPPVYQGFYTKIIDDHKEILAAYRANKRKKCNPIKKKGKERERTNKAKEPGPSGSTQKRKHQESDSEDEDETISDFEKLDMCFK